MLFSLLRSNISLTCKLSITNIPATSGHPFTFKLDLSFPLFVSNINPLNHIEKQKMTNITHSCYSSGTCRCACIKIMDDHCSM